MPSNAQARLRGSFYQVPDARPTDDMPDWLKSQFTQTSGQFQREDGSTGENWLTPGHIVRDSQGRRVVMLGDNRQLEHTNDLAMNPDYNPETDAYFDPDLGWVADGSKVNDQPWQKAKAKSRAISTAIIGAMVGAGAYSALGGAGAAGEAGVGLDALESFTAANPGWAEAYAAGEAGAGSMGLDALESVPFEQGMPFEQSPIPEMSDLFPEGIPSEGTFADTGWMPETAPSGSWLTPQNIARGVNGLRSILGGGGGSGGRSGGGSGGQALGGFGAPARIGDHKTDNDPYGLLASGWRGGMTADAKAKVTEAMMEKLPWKYDQVDPWRFVE